MFIRPCMMRQSNWEQVSMCFHLSPDVQGVRCTEIMLRQLPNSIIGNSSCTTCLSINCGRIGGPIHFTKTDLYSTAINSNKSAQNGWWWSIDHQACVWARHRWWCILHGMQALESPLVLGTEPPSSLTTTLDTELYPNISFIPTVLLTIPVTTATAERSFSSIKRIKKFLRATMTDTRLSSFGPP